MDLKLTPYVLFIYLFLFVCRMARSYKEVSSSQTRCRRETPMAAKKKRKKAKRARQTKALDEGLEGFFWIGWI